METKFTPGPWKVMYSSKNGLSALAVWTGNTQDGFVGSPICKVSPEETENEVDKANAKLIASAPDLLEAVKDLMIEQESLIRLGMILFPTKSFYKAEAAIKKATE